MDLKTICESLPCCPKPTRAEARREKLIATARTLFAQNGFHNTGIAQIAKHSGVLVGQIYRDFANKEEIVAAIVQRDIDRFLWDDPLREAACAGDTDAVRAWLAQFITGDAKGPEDHNLIADILAESSRNERIAIIVKAIHDRLRQTIADSLAVLAPEPAKEQRRELLTEVFLTISAGIFHRRLLEGGDMNAGLITALNRALSLEVDALIAS